MGRLTQSVGGSGSNQTAVDYFDAAGAYSLSFISGAGLVDVTCIGGGGGGGGGGKATNGTSPGGGGGGGGITRLAMLASIFGSGASITVGAGGNGGDGQTASVAKSPGTRGGDSFFGNYISAGGGDADNGTGLYDFGGYGLTSQGDDGARTYPQNDFNIRLLGCGSGGVSGFATSPNNGDGQNGKGPGTLINNIAAPNGGGLGGLQAASASVDAQDGAPGIGLGSGLPGCGGGGGGKGFNGSANISSAGAGGNGSFPGGGGGAGGSCDTNAASNAGDGGNGGGGQVVVITFA